MEKQGSIGCVWSNGPDTIKKGSMSVACCRTTHSKTACILAQFSPCVRHPFRRRQYGLFRVVKVYTFIYARVSSLLLFRPVLQLHPIPFFKYVFKMSYFKLFYGLLLSLSLKYFGLSPFSYGISPLECFIFFCVFVFLFGS